MLQSQLNKMIDDQNKAQVMHEAVEIGDTITRNQMKAYTVEYCNLLTTDYNSQQQILIRA